MTAHASISVPEKDSLAMQSENGSRPSLPVEQQVSVRDFMAAMAMNGMVSRTGTYQFGDIYRVDEDARKCYQIADAMMKAREPQKH